MGTGHAFGYCRFSVDAKGLAENVEDQEVWFREYAARTWPGVPVRVYSDNDKSAAKDEVYRPDYEAMNEAIARGECAYLWSVEQTRLERRLIPWLQYAAWLNEQGIEQVHTNRDGIIGTDDVVSELKGVLAWDEIRRLRRRVNDKLDRRAAQGLPPGGVCFGYQHDEDEDHRKILVVVPEEAEAIRWAAGEVLDGRPLSSIAKELAAQGLKGAKGGEIGPATVRSWVSSPTVAGKRMHRGQIVGDGVWEPVLDEATWQAVKAKLDHNAEQRVRPGRRRNYLLSGIAVCDCGRRMIGRSHARTGRAARPFYFCKGCSCSMSATDVDEHVTGELLARLEELVELRTPADEHHERRDIIVRELAVITEQRAELGRMWARRELDAPGWTAARETLDETERALTVELAAVPTFDAVIDPSAVRLGWGHNTTDEQREIISLFIERVVIERSRPGAPRKVDLSRVRIEGPGWQT